MGRSLKKQIKRLTIRREHYDKLHARSSSPGKFLKANRRPGSRTK